MGLFNKLLGKVFGGSKQQQDGGRQAQSRPQPGSARQQQSEWVDPHPPSKDLERDLAGVLAASFSQYEVKRNVSVKELNPVAEFGGPIDFALLGGGRIVAVIMIITNKRNKRYWGVEKACKATGVRLMNFYRHQWFTPEGAVSYISKFVR